MTIKKKILAIAIPMVLLITASIYFVVKSSVINTANRIETSNARSLLRTAMLSIENQYQSLKYHKEYSYNLRKQESEKVIQIGVSLMNEHYTNYKSGKISKQLAQKRALKALNELRFDNGNGYIWIIQIDDPQSYMLQHPVRPDLNFKPESYDFFNTGTDSVSILSKAIDLCKKSGSGFITYDWYKPTATDENLRQSKLSYVELYEPWNWVIVTGVYIDDIDTDVAKRMLAIRTELESTLGTITIGKSGYFFIINSNNDFIMHPFAKKFATDTIWEKQRIHVPYDAMKKAAFGSGMYEYTWNKPGENEKNFEYKKAVFVEYFEPLDWFVCASLYKDEIQKHGLLLGKKILIIILFFAAISMLTIYQFAIRFTKPINKLVAHVSRVDLSASTFNLSNFPKTSYTETQALSSAIKKMLLELEKHKSGLEKLVVERTHQLEAINEELSASNEALNHKNEIIVKQKNELEKTINNLREAQSKLIQSEKMASLGILTAGVAHEINNPLNFIKGAHFGLSKYFASHPQEKHKEIQVFLDGLKNGIERSTEIIKGLNQFSRDSETYDENCDLSTIIHNSLLMLKNKYKHKIEIHNELENIAELSVKGNVGKLHQVFLNILTNAIQAINTEGAISINASKYSNYIDIFIKDTGCGISKSNLSKIMDPFYTTKEPGIGTGLGLSITYNIIKDHHGEIEIESEPDKGTMVKIKLPLKK